jgi:hypothetical protein
MSIDTRRRTKQMLAERYILVTGASAGADAGRDSETDVAIEDEWYMESDRGAGDGKTRNLWGVGNGLVDGERDDGPGSGYLVLFNDDADNANDDGTDLEYEDRVGGVTDVRQ